VVSLEYLHEWKTRGFWIHVKRCPCCRHLSLAHHLSHCLHSRHSRHFPVGYFGCLLLSVSVPLIKRKRMSLARPFLEAVWGFLTWSARRNSCTSPAAAEGGRPSAGNTSAKAPDWSAELKARRACWNCAECTICINSSGLLWPERGGNRKSTTVVHFSPELWCLSCAPSGR